MYPTDRRYTNDHEWARKESDGTLTVGITQYAERELGEVVFVELPEVNSTLGSSDEFGAVASVKAVAELYAPVVGTITTVNGELAQSPSS